MSATTPVPLLTRRKVDLQIGIYFILLTTLSALASGLSHLPISFYLKNKLHLDAHAVAAFGAITSIPGYVGFLFGFLRDRWRPFGQGDRGFLLLSTPLSAALYIWLALSDLSYERLLIAVLLHGITGQMLGTATHALMASVAQMRRMTGRLGALLTIAAHLPRAFTLLLGGWLSSHFSAKGIFLLVAFFTSLLFFLGLWKPSAVFAGQSDIAPKSEGQLHAIGRLLRHRPLWPAVLIMAIWSFGPVSQTPLFFHLTNHVKLSSTQFGVFSAQEGFAAFPSALLFGFVCRRWKLRTLLWLATAFAIPQVIPLLFVHTFSSALMAGIAMGLVGGFATAAYFDLLMRSCPKGLEGTAMMLTMSGIVVIFKCGDLFGSWLYQWGGFSLGVWMTVAVYVLIAPILLLVPRHLTETHDGEVSETLQSELPSTS